MRLFDVFNLKFVVLPGQGLSVLSIASLSNASSILKRFELFRHGNVSVVQLALLDPYSLLNSE